MSKKPREICNAKFNGISFHDPKLESIKLRSFIFRNMTGAILSFLGMFPSFIIFTFAPKSVDYTLIVSIFGGLTVIFAMILILTVYYLMKGLIRMNKLVRNGVPCVHVRKDIKRYKKN